MDWGCTCNGKRGEGRGACGVWLWAGWVRGGRTATQTARVNAVWYETGWTHSAACGHAAHAVQCGGGFVGPIATRDTWHRRMSSSAVSIA